MSSSRLPGKVLQPIGDKPLLHHLCTRLENSALPLPPVIIATSDDPGDDLIADFCKANGARYFRGSLNNVASRFLELLKLYPSAYFIRINADSPLLDPRLILQAIDIVDDLNCDFLSTAIRRTYPVGQGVEVVKSAVFESVFKSFIADDEFEHVTTYFYNNLESVKHFSMENDVDCSSESLAVDTLEDLKKIKNFFDIYGNKVYTFTWQECLKRLKHD